MGPWERSTPCWSKGSSTAWPRGTERLAPMIAAFCRERILGDYLDDRRLLLRLNQVMRRLKFAPLPEGFAGLLPWARRLIDGRRTDLLAGIPA